MTERRCRIYRYCHRVSEVPNALEATALDGVDPDRLNQLAACLFTLNNRRFGPIPGTYVVFCVEADRRWCFGQLSADRAKPLVLFEDLSFDTPAAAQRAAERLRRMRGVSLRVSRTGPSHGRLASCAGRKPV